MHSPYIVSVLADERRERFIAQAEDHRRSRLARQHRRSARVRAQGRGEL